jgi:membrane protease YdiL (CAAX protease family)
MNSFTEPEQPRGPAGFLLGSDGLLRPLWRALGFAGVAYFSVSLLGLLYVGLAGPVQGLPGIPYYLILTAVLLLESWVFILAADERNFRTLGLWFYSGWWREALGGIGIGLLLISIVVGVTAATHTVQFAGWGRVGLTVWLHLLGTAVGLAIAAALEELLFRGYGFQRLIDAIGSWGAVAVSSIVFGLAHLQNPSVTVLSTVNTALSGAVLSVAYLKTRGLWLPIGLHWAWNFCMGPVFSFPVSGLRIEPVMLHIAIGGPAWLTGGEYGPEGGVVLTVAAVGAIVWLALDTRIGVSPEMQEALE